jgi:2-polyprenyl-3-methyl-5-hydroxy-6-metoxy-1,4-benzoquinol methylase
MKPFLFLAYDKYYQTKNLFGDPYPELIQFFEEYPRKGNVLDLGCGQGRDAITLARLGYSVTGIDNSKTGINQLNEIAQTEKLSLTGRVEDIYEFDQFEAFDIILLDSMFHFAQKDKSKEIGLIKKIISEVKTGCLVVVCIQDTGNKVQILNQTLDFEKRLKRLVDKSLRYTFEDQESGHKSETQYKLIVLEK